MVSTGSQSEPDSLQQEHKGVILKQGVLRYVTAP